MVERNQERERQNRGLLVAARYSLPALKSAGCGISVETGEKIRQRLKEPISQEEAKELLSNFKTARLFYQLIADSCCLSHYDEDVIRGYWLGNWTSSRVEAETLRKAVAQREAEIIGWEKAEKLAAKIPADVILNHSFNSFLLKLIFEGDYKEEFDSCRICWGKVLRKGKERLEISYQQIIKEEKLFTWSHLKKREIFWDYKFNGKPEIGNYVSFHYGQGCEVINSDDLWGLRHYTNLNRLVANYSLG